MPLHQPSDRWRFGLTLAFMTAVLWATLPVALKIALEAIDPYTLTWARFAFAAFFLGSWLAARGELRGFAKLPLRAWVMLILAAAALIGNYVFYLLGLQYTTPANAQLLIQAAPLLMGLGGIVVFRERYRWWQWLGVVAIAIGLLLFFRDQSARHAAAGSSYVLGSTLILIGAVCWATYAMLQKQLLNRLSSAEILFVIYVFATFALLPIAAPGSLAGIDRLHWFALVYCAVNTLGAYGAFAEALAHWEASRVSVVLALSPLMTVATVELVHAFWPGLVQPEQIAPVGWFGGALVLVGSVCASWRRPASVRT